MTVDVPDVNAAAGPSDSRWPLSRTQTAAAAKAAEEPVLATRAKRGASARSAFPASSAVASAMAIVPIQAANRPNRHQATFLASAPSALSAVSGT
jgi:hypothetical protein